LPAHFLADKLSSSGVLSNGSGDPHGEFCLSHDHHEDDTVRATAGLPGLEIEIVHGRSPDGDAEQIWIKLQAVPSFEAFGRFLDTANPFAFWAQAAQMAWLPWLEAERRLMLPSNAAAKPPQLSRRDGNGTPP
jgi:hypothetical protein